MILLILKVEKKPLLSLRYESGDCTYEKLHSKHVETEYYYFINIYRIRTRGRHEMNDMVLRPILY